MAFTIVSIRMKINDNMFMENFNKKDIWIFGKAFFLVGVIIGIKYLAHISGLEFLTINNLFSKIIAANVFLMGFLLSGVLSDYKESEKILGELALSIDTIIDANFIRTGYQISISITVLMCFGLVFSQIDPFYESLFFVGVISFLMIFLISLIHDLDAPFAYNNKYSAENVSLYPITRVYVEIETLNKERNIL